MELSLFYELTTDDPDVPGAVKQRFDETLEQIKLADALGFRTVWAVEHHLSKRSLSHNPKGDE